jgi:hypothetical protein
VYFASHDVVHRWLIEVWTEPLSGAHVQQHVGGAIRRVDCVYPNSMWRNFVRQSLSDTGHSVFGCDIVPDVLHRSQPNDGTREDDRAPRTPGDDVSDG